MKSLLIVVSALALASPALAQIEAVEPTATQSTTTRSTTTTPSTAPVVPATPEATTAEATTTTVAAAPEDPKALVASEFPAYDKDSNQMLDRTEFAAWMAALKAKNGEKPMATAAMAKWTNGAFSAADKDKSKSLTLAEVQTYLTAGA